MKFLPLFLLLTLPLLAQPPATGHLTYTEESLWEPPAGEENAMPDGIEEALRNSGAFLSNYEAVFGEHSFTYTEQPKEPVTIEQDGITIEMLSDGHMTQYYTDTEAATTRNLLTLGDRPFIVTDDTETLNWQDIDDPSLPTQSEQGFPLRYAVAVSEEGDTLRAGYTPSLPHRVGPRNYHHAGGAIITLLIRNADGGTMIRATGYRPADEGDAVVQSESEGKPVDREQFRRAEKKYRERMERQMRGYQRND